MIFFLVLVILDWPFFNNLHFFPRIFFIRTCLWFGLVLCFYWVDFLYSNLWFSILGRYFSRFLWRFFHLRFFFILLFRNFVHIGLLIFQFSHQNLLSNLKNFCDPITPYSKNWNLFLITISANSNSNYNFHFSFSFYFSSNTITTFYS